LKLVVTKRAAADLAALDHAARVRIAGAIQRLVSTNAGNIKKLQSVDPPEYRLRVGEWRVRFSRPDTGTIRINRVQDRKDVYR
jgi:mRNA interferase RelE/StbE